MEHVFTNRAAHVRGGTTSVTVRLPDEIVAYVDTHLDEDIANRSEFLQHWAQVGVRVSMSEELTEALDWALDESVQQVTVSLDDYGPVTITTEALGGASDGPAEDYHFEVPTMVLDQSVQPEPEPEITLAEIIETEEVAGPSWLPKPKGWEESTPSLDEIAAIRDAQLEALRSRVK